MAIELEFWSVALLLTKWVGYISFVTLVGGFFALGLDHRVSYLQTSQTHLQVTSRLLWPVLVSAAIVGAAMAVLSVLLQVGSINQRGLAGMLDWFMISIVGQSSVGGGNAMKLLGFTLFAIALVVKRPAFVLSSRAPKLSPLLLLTFVLALLSFALSFMYLGHVAPLGWLAKIAIALHIGAIGLWLGALLPLHMICSQRPPELALPLLRAFGQIGWGVIFALLLGGVFLLFELLHSVEQLFSSEYGLLLSAKLLLVVGLLSLAALNKFNLVRGLAESDGRALQKSIVGEILLATLILLLTAILTTVTGPMDGMV